MKPSILAKLSNILSITSFKIISGIIGFCCTIYVVISIFYPLSLQKVIVGFNFQPLQKNLTLIDNITKLVENNKTETMNHTITLGVDSFICDHQIENTTHKQMTILSFEEHRLNALRRKHFYFCIEMFNIDVTTEITIFRVMIVSMIAALKFSRVVTH